MNHIVRALFPARPAHVDDISEDCPLFCKKELEEVIFSMKNKKMPGFDGVPAGIYKLMFHHRSELLRIQCLLERRYF